MGGTKGAFEELVMVSVAQRASSRPLDACDLDRASRASTFLDELASDGLDLGLRLLVVDSLAAAFRRRADAGARSHAGETYLAYAAALARLREALDGVCARASARTLARLLAPDSALGVYVKALYLRASAVARALELFGLGALDASAPTADPAALARRPPPEETRLESAAFRFPDLRESIRRELGTVRRELGQAAVRDLPDAVERLFLASARLDAARAG